MLCESKKQQQYEPRMQTSDGLTVVLMIRQRLLETTQVSGVCMVCSCSTLLSAHLVAAEPSWSAPVCRMVLS
jgi:hypothetical protein